jgi:Protein of unknown function (DUF1326)
MKRILPVLLVAAAASFLLGAAGPDPAAAPSATTYEVTADSIEACSCPLFCTCYFGPSADEHMCEANNVYKFRKGSHYGNVDLSEQIVWMSLDLGGEWHKKPGPGMPTKWVVITFDKKSTEAQRKAIVAVANIVFPVKWAEIKTREDSISFQDGPTVAEAKMASGLASVKLDKTAGPNKTKPTAVKNLQYWFSTSNEGFNLAYSTHHFDGDHKFSYQKRNGFTIVWTVKGEIKPEAPKVAAK